MANAILTKFGSENTFTITLASLASGAGRSSSSVTNGYDLPAAMVSVKITSGSSAPTAYYSYVVYLLRDVGTIADDGWGGSDAAFTPENSQVLGSIIVTNDASKAFYGIFDTAPLGPLGPTWGIAVYNGTDYAINSTGSNHAAYYRYYYPEIQ